MLGVGTEMWPLWISLNPGCRSNFLLSSIAWRLERPIMGFIMTMLLLASPGKAIHHPCPVDNLTNCACSYDDIVCDDIHFIPHFMNDGHQYRSIDLSKKNLEHLPEGAFYHLEVRKIILNFNPLENNIHVGAFTGADMVLEDLHLGACRLGVLRRSMLNNMRQLRSLHLWNNDLGRIPDRIFQHTPRLESLYLWGNRLERLDEAMFEGLSRLRRLDLDRNRISDIRNNTFRHLRNLEVLHLGENNIFTIYGHTFAHLVSLKILNLDNTGITFLYGDAFWELRELLVLRLQNNAISFLLDNTFKNTRQLLILTLQNNKIDLIWSKTFIGLSNLQRLNLAGNRIKNLPPTVFHHSSNLTILNLDNNLLQTMRKCIFPPLTQLKTLSLVGNPINCDCRLTWLIDVVERKGTEVWGTCDASPAKTLTAITNRINYEIAACTFHSSECKQLGAQSSSWSEPLLEP